MTDKVPMTTKGYTTLSNELAQLKTIERPAVIKAISDAREHGDLSENAEYHAAKEKQSFIEGKIAELEDKVSRADIIDVSKITGEIIKFGATIRLYDCDAEEEIGYQIVGSDESDVKNGLLSITSPLARALIGKKANDAVEVSTPSGSKSYEVLNIQYI